MELVGLFSQPRILCMTPEFPDIIRDIISTGIQPWTHCTPTDIQLHIITGGLTNTLYRATCPSVSESAAPILVRIFGQADGLLNREVENEIYIELSKQGISPRLIGMFSWGRLEEFLSENQPLASGVDMIRMVPGEDNVALIAASLISLHDITLGSSPQSFQANIFAVLSKWLLLASRYAGTIRPSSRLPDLTPPTIDRLKVEVEYVSRTCLESLLTHDRVRNSMVVQRLVSEVLCHNDLLSGNIMLNPANRTIRLIDFEYSGINYAVADIANVFTAVCESIMLAGNPQNVRVNFPTRTVQLHFLECYLGNAIPVDEVDAVLVVIAGFAMADELRWTIWGIIQSNQSTVDFDYVYYYNNRFAAYTEYRQMFTDRFEKLS